MCLFFGYPEIIRHVRSHQVEQIAFAHTKSALGGKISVVFYNMTTLYFKASDEDDLRKTGFSKDLERALYQAKSTLSLKKAAEVTTNMYQITYTLPASKQSPTHLLKMDAGQQELYDIIQRNF